MFKTSVTEVDIFPSQGQLSRWLLATEGENFFLQIPHGNLDRNCVSTANVMVSGKPVKGLNGNPLFELLLEDSYVK